MRSPRAIAQVPRTAMILVMPLPVATVVVAVQPVVVGADVRCAVRAIVMVSRSGVVVVRIAAVSGAIPVPAAIAVRAPADAVMSVRTLRADDSHTQDHGDGSPCGPQPLLAPGTDSGAGITLES